ncbi:MAG: hypothetical protein ACR2M3_00410, partial [Thermomicrobiales bacterium]
MDDVSSLACPMTAGTASVAMARDASRSLLRWVVLGVASMALLVLALMQSASVGAAAPTTYGNGGCVYNTACGTNTGYPPNTALSSYFDPRYGFVSVVTDASGNLIDVNSQTGQRIYPVFPDYGIGGVIGNGFIGANFVNGGFIPPGTTNGITCNGLYGCPLGGGFIGNGNFVNGFNGINANFVNGFNGFNGGFFNGNTFPAGATNVGGGVFTYNDNRFCGDGKVAFVVGRGYFCQNGGPLVTNNTVTTVNCGNFFLNGCGIYRPFEVNASTPQQASTVTAYAATTPKAAAPVVAQAAAPVVQAVVAPKAPVTAPAMAAPIVA